MSRSVNKIEVKLRFGTLQMSCRAGHCGLLVADSRGYGKTHTLVPFQSSLKVFFFLLSFFSVSPVFRFVVLNVTEWESLVKEILLRGKFLVPFRTNDELFSVVSRIAFPNLVLFACWQNLLRLAILPVRLVSD